MAENTYHWPDASKRKLIGKRMNPVDGPVKASGRAKYTYDLVRPNMLYGDSVKCPYAHARVKSIDTSAAEKMPGVKAVHVIHGPDDGAKGEVFWAGTDIVAVAAVDEPTARDAVRAIKVEYEQLPHLVLNDKEPNLAEAEKSEFGFASGRIGTVCTTLADGVEGSTLGAADGAEAREPVSPCRHLSAYPPGRQLALVLGAPFDVPTRSCPAGRASPQLPRSWP